MWTPYGGDLAGRIDRLTIDSAALADNPLGDPTQRPIEVYVPPGYDNDPWPNDSRPEHRRHT